MFRERLAPRRYIDRSARSIFVELHLLRSGGGEAAAEIDAAQFSGPTEEVRERIESLETDGALYAANSMHLTVVENQRAVLQVGKTVAVVTGTNFFGGTRRANSYQDRQVGTLVSVQAVASDEGGIAMNLQFEKSEVQAAGPGGADEQPIPATTTTLTHQSTVQLKDGHSMLVGTLVDRSGDQSTGAYLVIGAKLQQEQGGSVSFRAFSHSQPPARSTGRTRAAGSSNRAFGGLGSSSFTPRRTSSGGAAGRSGSSRSSAASNDERYQRYAAGLVSRYDTDGDGSLNAEERKQMSRKYPEADTDKDGQLTVDELTKALKRR